jgi:hypothetical protein
LRTDRICNLLSSKLPEIRNELSLLGGHSVLNLFN